MATFRSTILLLLLVGCTGGDTVGLPATLLAPNSPGIATPDVVVAIELSADSMHIYSPNFYMQRLGVQGVTRAGERVNLPGVRWHSSNPAIIWVDSLSGTLIVPATGRSRITATWRGLSDTAELVAETLCRGPALSAAGPSHLRVGEEAQWTASFRECPGVSGGVVRFASIDTTVLAMTPAGLGTALRAGKTIVTATLDSGRNSLSVALTTVVDP